MGQLQHEKHVKLSDTETNREHLDFAMISFSIFCYGYDYVFSCTFFTVMGMLQIRFPVTVTGPYSTLVPIFSADTQLRSIIKQKLKT